MQSGILLSDSTSVGMPLRKLPTQAYLAVVKDSQVDQVELITEALLWHIIIAFPVTSHNIMALRLQTLAQM